MRVKFPNGHCLKSLVWLGPKHSNWKVRGPEYIDFVSFQEFNPNLIRSGIWKKTFGKQLEFSGFRSSMTYNFTNVFNVFTMEWTKDYIYWKLNGQIYWTELINGHFELENGTNHNKIREPFYGKYTISFQLVCDPINDRRVDENCWTNPYLFIDYIKIYYSPDSETHENLKNITATAEDGSELNHLAVSKYVMTGFLALFLMLIVFFCFVLYFINKRTNIANSINRANSNNYETTKKGDFQESFDLCDNNSEQNDYYEIVESQVVEDSQNLNNTYLEII